MSSDLFAGQRILKMQEGKTGTRNIAFVSLDYTI
jgi:hypothetical protein